MPNILLLTATVSPPAGAPLLFRSSPSDRWDDYRKALRFYSGLLKSGVFDRLVVAENSGSSPDSWMSILDEEGVADRCEFLGLGRSGACGTRFAEELRLIQQSIERSRCLRANADAVVWKVTGRYIIRNVEQIVQRRPEQFDLYLNCRNVPACWLDFFIAGFRWPAFLESGCEDLHLFEASMESGESILRRRIDEGCYGSLRIVKRIDPIPSVIGIRGVDGARYHGLRLRTKHHARVALNRVAPWLWV